MPDEQIRFVDHVIKDRDAAIALLRKILAKFDDVDSACMDYFWIFMDLHEELKEFLAARKEEP